MILELDIGNTRVKWRYVDNLGAIIASGALSQMREDGRAENWWEKIEQLAHRPTRVRVGSVAGKESNQYIRDACQKSFQCEAAFAVSSHWCAGVQNGYHTPEKLGVDRWLAVLAAFNRFHTAVCIIDAGSAITVDYVDGAGQHHGGVIAPGLSMMAASLLRGTAGVRFDAMQAQAVLALGKNTQEAVYGGVMMAAVGLIQQALNAVPASQFVVLTGGDAEVLKPHLAVNTVLATDLVLEGLQFALP